MNYGRDYRADIIIDIAVAEQGFGCPECDSFMRTSRGVEVGNIFKLGTRYSDAMACAFLDKDGKSRPVIMGSYSIGVGRLLACIAEEHHDKKGLIWPVTIAPYQLHLIALPEGEDLAEQIYRGLQSSGSEVLYDDRDESPGVKFTDADLIGIPLRLTVSKRSIQEGGVEVKVRSSGESTVVPLEQLQQVITSTIAALESGTSR